MKQLSYGDSTGGKKKKNLIINNLFNLLLLLSLFQNNYFSLYAIDGGMPMNTTGMEKSLVCQTNFVTFLVLLVSMRMAKLHVFCGICICSVKMCNVLLKLKSACVGFQYLKTGIKNILLPQ